MTRTDREKKNKVCETGDCVLHEEKAYAAHAFVAKEKMMDFFVLTKSGDDEEEEMWVGKVLLLFCCVMERAERATKMQLYCLGLGVFL